MTVRTVKPTIANSTQDGSGNLPTLLLTNFTARLVAVGPLIVHVRVVGALVVENNR